MKTLKEIIASKELKIVPRQLLNTIVRLSNDKLGAAFESVKTKKAKMMQENVIASIYRDKLSNKSICINSKDNKCHSIVYWNDVNESKNVKTALFETKSKNNVSISVISAALDRMLFLKEDKDLVKDVEFSANPSFIDFDEDNKENFDVVKSTKQRPNFIDDDDEDEDFNFGEPTNDSNVTANDKKKDAKSKNSKIVKKERPVIKLPRISLKQQFANMDSDINAFINESDRRIMFICRSSGNWKDLSSQQSCSSIYI